MKKIISLLLVTLMTAAIFAGCGGKSDYIGEINVCNWGEYIDESLLSDFEAKTKIKVNYSTFTSNETLYSVLKNGGSEYDVIIPSDYMIARLINEDMLEPLNFDNIPNYSLVGDQYKNLEYDPEGKYSVGYTWGTVVLIYNSEMVDEDITSWGAMFDEKYSGEILMFDNPRDAIGIALEYLGYSLNTTDKAELDEAYALLAKQKPLVQAYVMDQIFDKLESGEAAIGPYYAGDYLTMLENNENLKCVIPEEGSNSFVDAMCVPKGSKNKELAESFINFMCSTEACLKNMDFIGYTSVNVEAQQQYAADLDELSKEVMFPSDDKLKNNEVFTNLPQETLDYYDELWVKLKS